MTYSRAGATLGLPEPRSLRARITAWWCLVISLCLAAYSATIAVSYRAHVDAELNRSVQEDLELAIRAIHVDEKGTPSWPNEAVWQQVREEEGGGHLIEVWSLGGRRLLAVGTVEPLNLGPPAAARLGKGTRTLELPAGPFRVAADQVELSGTRFVIRVAVSEIAARKEVHSLWEQLAVLSLAVLVLGGFGGYLLARRFLGPLARMAEHARRITAEHLEERLSLEDAGTELNQVRDAFNETLGRLQRSFDQLRRFTADASHEIRTPLTALRSVGEVGLRRARTPGDFREVIGSMLEEVDRLSRLADGLLTLARAESGQSALRIEPVDLGLLACEVTDRLSVLAEERRQALETETAGAVVVSGDRLALRQALTNLVDNAIKYAGEGTRVRVRVERGPCEAFVEVHDEGPGIPTVHQDRVFERFYRVDAGRSREQGGTGLGLSLVKWAAEAHGGRVELTTEEGRGSTFRLILPFPAKAPLPA